MHIEVCSYYMTKSTLVRLSVINDAWTNLLLKDGKIRIHCVGGGREGGREREFSFVESALFPYFDCKLHIVWPLK